MKFSTVVQTVVKINKNQMKLELECDNTQEEHMLMKTFLIQKKNERKRGKSC